MYRETNKRIILRTLTFKICTTTVTTLIVGLGNALFIHFLMTLIYLGHEKGWNRINWGKKAPKPQPYELLRNESKGHIPYPEGNLEPMQSERAQAVSL